MPPARVRPRQTTWLRRAGSVQAGRAAEGEVHGLQALHRTRAIFWSSWTRCQWLRDAFRLELMADGNAVDNLRQAIEVGRHHATRFPLAEELMPTTDYAARVRVGAGEGVTGAGRRRIDARAAAPARPRGPCAGHHPAARVHPAAASAKVLRSPAWRDLPPSRRIPTPVPAPGLGRDPPGSWPPSPTEPPARRRASPAGARLRPEPRRADSRDPPLGILGRLVRDLLGPGPGVEATRPSSACPLIGHEGGATVAEIRGRRQGSASASPQGSTVTR